MRDSEKLYALMKAAKVIHDLREVLSVEQRAWLLKKLYK